jgi:hypothetical protein
MRLLVLGGTAWLGRYIAATAGITSPARLATSRASCLRRGLHARGPRRYRRLPRGRPRAVGSGDRRLPPAWPRPARHHNPGRPGRIVRLRLLHQRLRRPRDTGSRRERCPPASAGGRGDGEHGHVRAGEGRLRPARPKRVRSWPPGSGCGMRPCHAWSLAAATTGPVSMTITRWRLPRLTRLHERPAWPGRQGRAPRRRWQLSGTGGGGHRRVPGWPTGGACRRHP